MARMLRPYQPENIIGDFEKNNEFYLGDDTVYRNGKLEIALGPRRTLFARMTVRRFLACRCRLCPVDGETARLIGRYVRDSGALHARWLFGTR